MENMQEGGMTLPTSIISKITHFSAEDKIGVTNAIQYIALAVIPVALSNKIVKNLFNSTEPISKGSVELLAEIIGQSIVTTLLLYLVNKVIIAIPTYTTEPIKEINIITIAIVITFGLFAFNNNKIADKFNILYNRIQKMWTGTDNEKNEPVSQKNKISISKPVAKMRTAMPTHQESRADYVVTHNQMEPPQVASSQNGGNNPTNDTGNSAVGLELPMFEEPAAFNSTGGFSPW
jgi:hypothetical protein